jgi:D-tyrosyl-tRNA(Tyr) deacylase
MKFLIQRVSQASVYIHETNTTNHINQWLLVYIWISVQDLQENRKEKIHKFVRRISKYDLFSSEAKRKSLGLQAIWWELLIISNFTLYGRNKKSSSIDFCHAAPYDEAEHIYNFLIEQLLEADIPHKTGAFGAMMDVSSVCNGPVNVVLEW